MTLAMDKTFCRICTESLLDAKAFQRGGMTNKDYFCSSKHTVHLLTILSLRQVV